MIASVVAFCGNLFVAQTDAESMLAVLQARDRSFDNIHVIYERSGVDVKNGFGLRDFRTMKPGDVISPTKSLKYLLIDQMLLRGLNITFIRNTDAERTETAEGYPKRMPFHHWSNKDGVYRCLSDTAVQGPFQYRFETQHSASMNDLMLEQLFEVEFALGLGFAKRMSRITSLDVVDSRCIVHGPIHVWKEDVSTCRLVIDENHVTRRANIDIDAGGHRWRLDIATEGVVRTDRLVFPATGVYRRFRIDEKKADGPAKPFQEFTIAFKSIRYDLPDVAYESLTEIRPKARTHITDGDTRAQSYLDENGALKLLRQKTRPIPSPNDRSQTVVLLFLGHLFLFSVGYYLFRRYRNTSRS